MCLAPTGTWSSWEYHSPAFHCHPHPTQPRRTWGQGVCCSVLTAECWSLAMCSHLPRRPVLRPGPPLSSPPWPKSEHPSVTSAACQGPHVTLTAALWLCYCPHPTDGEKLADSLSDISQIRWPGFKPGRPNYRAQVTNLFLRCLGSSFTKGTQILGRVGFSVGSVNDSVDN